MDLVRRMYADVDVSTLATAFLIGVLRTILYFAAGTLAMAALGVIVVLAAIGSTAH